MPHRTKPRIPATNITVPNVINCNPSFFLCLFTHIFSDFLLSENPSVAHCLVVLFFQSVHFHIICIRRELTLIQVVGFFVLFFKFAVISLLFCQLFLSVSFQKSKTLICFVVFAVIVKQLHQFPLCAVVITHILV